MAARRRRKNRRIYTNTKKRKMRRMRRIRNGIIALFIAAALFLGWYFLRPGTELENVPSLVTPSYGETASVEFSLTRSENRKIYLEKQVDDKWEKVSEYTTEEEGASSVSVTMDPEEYGKEDTLWRIRVKGTLTKKGVTSEEILVQPMNIGEMPDLTAEAAVILTMEDAKIILGINQDEELPSASTTKIMTALITMEDLDGEGTAVVSEENLQVKDGGMNKALGGMFKISDLWHAMLIGSVNDAAELVAETDAGSEAAFVEKMNARAEEMGLKHTHFSNSYGWDEDDHYSSAYDLAMIDREAMKQDLFREIILKKNFTLTPIGNASLSTEITATNELLSMDYEGHLGGKTGTTDRAGQCFVSNFEYDGVTYITVVLGSTARYSDTIKLYEYIKNTY